MFNKLKSKNPINKSKRKNKKGITLAEVSIAMVVIALTFLIALSNMLAMSATYNKMDNSRFFTTEISNYLECYKIEGEDGFESNVKILLNSSLPQKQDNKYVIYYLNNYSVTTNPILASFILEITIDESFYAIVSKRGGSVVYKMKEKYISRFDM